MADLFSENQDEMSAHWPTPHGPVGAMLIETDGVIDPVVSPLVLPLISLLLYFRMLPAVFINLPYFGAPRNDGFIMMPNEVEAYRIGDKPYEFRGTNGFMITFDIKSSDFKAEAQKGGS